VVIGTVDLITITKKRIQVDTGAEISVYPVSKLRYRPAATKHQQYAANGSIIATFGSRAMDIKLGDYRTLLPHIQPATFVPSAWRKKPTPTQASVCRRSPSLQSI
jgi:hypothetical protein